MDVSAQTILKDCVGTFTTTCEYSLFRPAKCPMLSHPFRELDAEGNLDTTLGVLRCAHLWEMPTLRRRAHRVLRQMWSDDVNGLGWGGSEGQARHIIESSSKVVKYVFWTKNPQDVILLPAAYYFLTITRGYKHLSGLTGREKNNLLAHTAALNDIYYDILRGVVHDILYVGNNVGEDGAQHLLKCRDPQRWRAALKSWTDARFASYGRMMGGEEQVFDPLEELVSTAEFERSLEVFAQNTCTACAERLRKYLKEKRYELWENLPQRFDLPKWKELRESLSGWVPDPEDM